MYTYLRKGTLILVEGSLKPRQWSKDDVKINTLGVSVRKIQLLSSPKSAAVSEAATKEALADEAESFNSDVPDNLENIDPFEDKTQGIF